VSDVDVCMLVVVMLCTVVVTKASNMSVSGVGIDMFGGLGVFVVTTSSWVANPYSGR